MTKYNFPALNLLRTFEAAARHQSFRKACDELHVTHAAISRTIRLLEEQLGRELFERHHRKVVLNEDGKRLLAAVATAFSHIQRALTQISGDKHPDRLVISVDPDFSALWLVPRLAEFYAIVPNTLVEILAEGGLSVFHDPRIDCAIQYAAAGLELENSEVLFRSRLFPVYAPGVAQMPPLNSPDDLGHHTLLHDRTFDEWHEYVQSYPKALDIDVELGLIFSATSNCLDAAARGQGVAIGDDFLAAIHLSEGRLVKPFDVGFLSKNAYYFIAPERAVPYPAVDVFRAWLFEGVDRVRMGNRSDG